jgi:hypothetical protein
MKKNYKLEIPEYLSIGIYQQLQNLEHLSELGKLIEAIHVFTGITRDELKTWSIPDLGRVAKDYSSIDTQEQFYPLIKLNDKTYGYADISAMSLGEFVDLENLCKKPNINLHEIMAVLYREVKSHKFDNFIWNIKHNIQISRNKVDNVFKWYKIREYNSEDREVDSIVMKELPVSLALGALSFFLSTASLHYLNSINFSEMPVAEKAMIRMARKTNLEALVHIGDGLRQYTLFPRQIFSPSLGIKVSLN